MKWERLKATVRGAVQGVGFRPFVYRLAREIGLRGWVLNSSQGVFIEAEGERAALEKFLLRLEKEKPPRAIIQSLEFSFLDPIGYETFEIRESTEQGAKTTLILPDIATCPDCVREIFDPNDRRYLYPFTNCTNCGPRFSIIESLPYDRPNTAMKGFTMCVDCEREYHDPNNRRFHAQPNACPQCGPQLELWNAEGKILAKHHEALLQTAAAIRDGKIVALKGIGGFQLIVDVGNHEAVRRLRQRKHREEKPFAVMYPSFDAVKNDCVVDEFENRLLLAPEAPIVLLQQKTESRTQNAQIAPGNPYLGVMLPYSPLHHVLLRELNFPIVATSGNVSDEPMCLEEREALERLRDIADLFLVHNRPIVRQVDDSIVRVVLHRELVMRRARGYAPLPVQIKSESENLKPEIVLAVGAHLKNTVALAVGSQVFISQHIGDLETPHALKAFQRVAEDFQKLYEAKPQLVAHDLHPEYLSTKFAEKMISGATPETERETRAFSVQHHFAHVVACLAENEIAPPVLGISWDGTGYGGDGTIWGGEFLVVNGCGPNETFTRFAHFRNFPLPGGEMAVKQPRRIALGLLWEILGGQLFERRDLPLLSHFSNAELTAIRQMLVRKINSPLTCSVGRLFDAVAALVGLRQQTNFEGQAAMELEFALDKNQTDEFYNLSLIPHPSSFVIDWQPMILQMLEDVRVGQPAGFVSAKFHNALAEVAVAVAKATKTPSVILSGGCFQNKYLIERAVTRLRAEGFRAYWPQRVPPNDGGIALGQAVAAIWQLRQSEESQVKQNLNG